MAVNESNDLPYDAPVVEDAVPAEQPVAEEPVVEEPVVDEVPAEEPVDAPHPVVAAHASLDAIEAQAAVRTDGNALGIIAHIRRLLNSLHASYQASEHPAVVNASALDEHTAAIEAAPRARLAPVFRPSTEEEIANDPSPKAAEAAEVDAAVKADDDAA